MIRKIGVVMVASLLIILTVSTVAAFDLPFGGKKDAGAKVDVQALSSRSASVMSNVRKATVSFAEALFNVEVAVGHKAEAEKLQQAINNAKEKPNDINAIKALSSEVNNAADDVDKCNLQSDMNKQEAQKNLGNSILKIGAGLIFDATATKEAPGLLSDAKGALKQVSLLQAGKVKEIITVAQFVTAEIPSQMTHLQKVSGKLVDYAKTNGIPTPSKEDIQKKVLEMTEG
jgi:hypothetical protein